MAQVVYIVYQIYIYWALLFVIKFTQLLSQFFPQLIIRLHSCRSCTFGLDGLVLGKRFGLAVAGVNPLFELVHRHLRHGAHALPAFLVVTQIAVLRFLQRIKAKHTLVLVELAGINIALIHDKDLIARQVRTDEHIYMVAVHTLGATNLAVGMVHLLLPLFAVSVRTTTDAAFRILNGDRQPPQGYMTLFVVLCFLLCLGRVGVRLCLGLCKTIFRCYFGCFSIVVRIDQRNRIRTYNFAGSVHGCTGSIYSVNENDGSFLWKFTCYSISEEITLRNTLSGFLKFIK